ncbi:MAG TPA: nuclear transport factor 2 family protein [Thermoanaerobaculia bacterium]|nr:nuclear transport factor 2 family protein [Thermoanaerobaculia bacterium]
MQAPPGKAAAVHDELRAFRDGLLDAVNKGDLERELAYFHPNVVVTWHNAEVSRSRDGVRAYLNRMLKSPGRVVAAYHADVNVDELTILYGDEVGISFGSALEHFEMVGGKRLDLPARWSATLVKAGGKWLIASLHASDNLFDNPLLAIAKRMAWWAGGLGVMAGVAGLAGGFALGRRRRRA